MSRSHKKHPIGRSYNSIKWLKRAFNRSFRKRERQAIVEGREMPNEKDKSAIEFFDAEKRYEPESENIWRK